MDDGCWCSGFSPGLPVTIPRSHGPSFFNVSGHTTVSQTIFFLSLFQPRTSVTIPCTRSVRLWYGHWRPSLKYQKKKPVWQTVVWPLAFKKTQSVGPWYGLWHTGAKCVRKKPLIWQTVVWPLGLKNPGLTDQGVATGVTKFRMASGGLSHFIIWKSD